MPRPDGGQRAATLSEMQQVETHRCRLDWDEASKAKMMEDKDDYRNMIHEERQIIKIKNKVWKVSTNKTSSTSQPSGSISVHNIRCQHFG